MVEEAPQKLVHRGLLPLSAYRRCGKDLLTYLSYIRKEPLVVGVATKHKPMQLFILSGRGRSALTVHTYKQVQFSKHGGKGRVFCSLQTHIYVVTAFSGMYPTVRSP